MAEWDHKPGPRSRMRTAVLALTLAALALVNAEAAGEDRPPVVQPPASAPPLTLSSSTGYVCAYVTARKDRDKPDTETKLAFGATFCPAVAHASELIPDEGDVTVVIPADQFYKALEAKPANSPWLLSLNGKSLADGAVLDSQIARGSEVLLRFRISAGTTARSQEFWTSAYQRSGFGAYEPLYVEVGWDAIPEYFRPPPTRQEGDKATYADKLRVADSSVIAIALGAGLIVLGLFVWAMGWTDIFRIGARPMTSSKRLAFSFARVQWGLWTCFAVTAALYLWAVYGSFPAVTGTVFQLAAVSTLTATTSFFMDANNRPVPQFSANLLRDLLSGNNDDIQAHRFQALLVNGLLLLAGIVFVARRLGYPDFPETWVAMLGISNAAALAGKQLLENQPSTSASTPVDKQAAVPTQLPSVPAGRTV
jgi:hypothetical protein